MPTWLSIALFCVLVSVNIECFHYNLVIGTDPGKPVLASCLSFNFVYPDGSKKLIITNNGIVQQMRRSAQQAIPEVTVDNLVEQLRTRRPGNIICIWIQLEVGSSVPSWHTLEKFSSALDRENGMNQLEISDYVVAKQGCPQHPFQVTAKIAGQTVKPPVDFKAGIRISGFRDLHLTSTLVQTGSQKNETKMDFPLLQVRFSEESKSEFQAILDGNPMTLFYTDVSNREAQLSSHPFTRLFLVNTFYDTKKLIIEWEVKVRETEMDVELKLLHSVELITRLVKATAKVLENLNELVLNPPEIASESGVWTWKLDSWEQYLKHKNTFSVSVSVKFRSQPNNLRQSIEYTNPQIIYDVNNAALLSLSCVGTSMEGMLL